MKYLYQQLLAFWSLIIVVLLIIGFSFMQFTRSSLEQTNYTQLFGYANGMQENYIKLYDSATSYEAQQQALLNSLTATESVLAHQEVRFYFLDSEQNVLYPFQENKPLKINSNDWQKVSDPTFNGQIAATSSTNLFGQNEATSYIMLPFFSQNNTFAGALVVSQPAKNIEKTLNPLIQNLIKGFVISTFVALFLSYILANYQMKRINRLKKATKEIAQGHFDVQVPVKLRKDEIEELGEDFNKMAESLAQYKNEVEEQEERRIQFMADATHEMRTPLTTINGLIEGLSHDAIPENKKASALRLMENETNRLIRLVNENLDYEKIRTNQISMMIKAFNGNQAIERIVTQMSQKAQKAGNTLTFKNEEQVTVYADYDRFIQVLVNIVQNAIQFTQDGAITLTLHKVAEGAEVTVSDTGIGMTEEQQKNIWDRYYKVDPSRKNTKYGESGLGLPIVQQLVRLHGGKIIVDSTPNQGTTFTIFFPDHEPEETKKSAV